MTDSRLRQARSILSLLALICVGMPAAAQETAAPVHGTAGNGSTVGARTPRSYVVRSGDTLVGIALHELGDARAVHAILALNPEIRDPNRIRAAQVIALPEPVVRPDARSSWNVAEIFGRVYRRLETLGVASLTLSGLAAIIAVAIAFQAGVHLVLGAFLLWFGALLVGGSPRVRFGQAFAVNLKGTIASIATALAAWALLAIVFSFVAHDELLRVAFDRVVLGVFLAVAAVHLGQFLVYLAVVRAGFATTYGRAFGACLLAFCFQVLFSVALTPALSSAALGS